MPDITQHGISDSRIFHHYIPDISAKIANEFKGTALLQMINNRKIKVEILMGKTPNQVSWFSNNAQTYER